MPRPSAGVLLAGAVLTGLIAAGAVWLGSLPDLDADLSRRLSFAGAQVVCSGVKVVAPGRLTAQRIRVAGPALQIEMTDVRMSGSVFRGFLPGPERCRISSRTLSLLPQSPFASGVAIELGPASARLRVSAEGLSVRSLRLNGPDGRAAGGFDVVSGRLRRAHLSVRLDRELRRRLEPLYPAISGGLDSETYLRLVLMNDRLRVNGARRPILDLTWASA